MKRLQVSLWQLINVLFVGFATSVNAEENTLNMTRGVTGISNEVYDLHMLIFYICCAIAVVVFGAMFYSMYHHRKSKGAVAANFHESTKVEVIWTVIPIIILVLMAIPATRTLVAMEDTSQSDLTIKVTGSQWKWHYSYFGEDVEFFSLLATSQKAIDGIEEKGAHYLLEVDNPLVLPINRKVRFLLTSDDVIHSWWVPDFAVKKDTIPGFINEAWTRIDEPGVYRGQCAELCGRAHGFMPVVVHAMEEDKYDAWLLAKKAEIEQAKQEAAASLTASLSQEELMTIGEKVYVDRCAVCHQVSGAGIPGAFPAITGSKIATGDVDTHIDVVVNGRAGTAMQAFANQLSDKEIAAVVTYQRNGLGNSTGDVVQASDVNAFKASKEGQ
ncbi:cytochrome c oxidase subunit II [Vibrio coralliilyticus]|uniref:Cytochrome c oxidase subunit 2 n=2 Tax=Vibrio coralliilyticus TaxID=190893 RepID=A0A2A2CM09_9VIBR|nr:MULTISPECIES: cytochrome c oxidase subunit II [Vibrio]AIS56659.1 cytochrome B559 subunit alpha [Vibrio coralliilyticus]AIW21881.1 cytochrome B559 subunit alpha [Vibrio coralliilyticus]AXN33566.1 cytochrome c oxidase subunit II [Vibrio coralliilyticus]EEX33029.1 cytochrome c oxidase polypeptide II [Vibrio coralliilyticus ATCC BAA-450]ERB63332.1 cytochrome B559 subunit alpha [Vibrio coralliilyticus OCN008]